MAEKSEMLKTAVKFIRKIPPEAWERLSKKTNEKNPSISGAGDYEIERFLVEMGLTNTKKLAKFMVQVQEEQFNSVYEGINDIREDLLKKEVAALKTGRTRFLFWLDNKQEKWQYRDIMNDAEKLLKPFEESIDTSVKIIHEMDMAKGVKFKIQSFAGGLKRCDANVMLATQAAQYLLNAYEHLYMVASYEHFKMDAYDTEFEELRQTIFKRTNRELMAAYSKTPEQREFWENLLEILAEVRERLSCYRKCIDVEKDSEEKRSGGRSEMKNERTYWDEEDNIMI